MDFENQIIRLENLDILRESNEIKSYFEKEAFETFAFDLKP